MNSPTDNEQDLPQHRKDTRAILPFLRDGQDAACLIDDPKTLQRIQAQTSTEKGSKKSFTSDLKRDCAKGASEMECMKTEIDGIEGIYKDIAEDSLRKEVALTNATAAKKAAEDCFRDKLDAYNEHRTALAEEFHKAIVAVKEENTKDEVTALNLLKDVEELRERQNNLLKDVEELRERQNSRSVECEQKKELQEKELEQKHHEGTESAMSRYNTAKEELQEKEELAMLVKANTLTVSRNLTEKKAEIERMRKDLNKRKEAASSHNTWGGGDAHVEPKNLALANQDYDELKSDLIHHMDDSDIESVLRTVLRTGEHKSGFLKFVKNTGIVYNKNFPDDPKIKVSRKKMDDKGCIRYMEGHPEWLERIVGYFTRAPKVITVENEATARSFGREQPAQSRKRTAALTFDLPPRTPLKKRSASDIDYVNSTILQSPHLTPSKKARLGEVYGSANSSNSLFGGHISSSSMHESPLIEIRSAKEQEQRGNTSSPSVARKM